MSHIRTKLISSKNLVLSNVKSYASGNVSENTPLSNTNKNDNEASAMTLGGNCPIGCKSNMIVQQNQNCKTSENILSYENYLLANFAVFSF